MYEALFQESPFQGEDQKELSAHINNGLVKLPPNVKVSNTCLDFLSKCLCFEMEKRISIDHALNHPFINQQSPQYLEAIDIFYPKNP